MVRLDEESKQYRQAADLRHISVSDYVRTVTIPQARREVRAAQEHVVTLTSEEQLSFWTALRGPQADRCTAASGLRDARRRVNEFAFLQASIWNAFGASIREIVSRVASRPSIVGWQPKHFSSRRNTSR